MLNMCVGGLGLEFEKNEIYEISFKPGEIETVKG